MNGISPTSGGSRVTRSIAPPRRRRNAKRVRYTRAHALTRPQGRGSTRPDRLGKRRWPYFRRILAALRSNCTTRLPVTVHVGHVRAGDLGWCRREPRWFSIRLSGRLTQEAAIDVLVHEWAHAMSWDQHLDRMSRSPCISAQAFEAAAHGPAWGVAYSRAYLVFVAEVTRLRRERALAARRRT
jgi:hypothetical protein